MSEPNNIFNFTGDTSFLFRLRIIIIIERYFFINIKTSDIDIRYSCYTTLLWVKYVQEKLNLIPKHYFDQKPNEFQKQIMIKTIGKSENKLSNFKLSDIRTDIIQEIQNTILFCTSYFLFSCLLFYSIATSLLLCMYMQYKYSFFDFFYNFIA